MRNYHHITPWKGLLLFGIATMLFACQQDRVSSDPSLQLSFSHDTVLFDTVFTAMGTSTHRVMVYNPHKNAINIKQVSMQEGKYFHINLDGENDMEQLRDVIVRGEDSLFLFIRAYIDPLDENSPVLIEDKIAFQINEKTQQITLQAYGQNIEKIQIPSDSIVYECHLTNEKLYLLYDTIHVSNLTIDAGSSLYMHEGAALFVYGSMQAQGTKDQPIIFRGDRTDKLFDSVPYRMASGQWDGIYLLHAKEVFPPSK